MIPDYLKQMLDALSLDERDTAYRYLWQDYVKADIVAFANDNDINLNDDTVEFLAEKYVNTAQDANLNYWTTIENCIDKELKRND